jgi:deoxyadenosine/deoxycytidine kinase
MNSNTIITIEGNIGCGKSTILNCINEYNNHTDIPIILVEEPVDEWENIKDDTGKTILQLFYENPHEYAFSFQMMAYISRLNNLKKAIMENTNSIIVTERSLLTDKLVFAKMLKDDNKIKGVDYAVYLNWFDTFSKDFPVDKVIYMNSSPETCYNRISRRSRTGENNITLDYLSNCHKYHENMMDNYCQMIKPENIYIFNAEYDSFQTASHHLEEFYKMMKFILNNA